MSTHMKFIVSLSSLMFVPIFWHFATVIGYLGDPPQTRGEFFLRISLIATSFIILSIISAMVISARAGSDVVEPDERDQLVGIRAERNGGWILMAGLVCLMWFAFTPMQPMDVANAALALIALGEAVKIVSGVFYLRRRS